MFQNRLISALLCVCVFGVLGWSDSSPLNPLEIGQVKKIAGDSVVNVTNRVSVLEAEMDTAQDGITGLQNTQSIQTGSINALENSQASQTQSIKALESTQATQSTSINSRSIGMLLNDVLCPNCSVMPRITRSNAVGLRGVA